MCLKWLSVEWLLQRSRMWFSSSSPPSGYHSLLIVTLALTGHHLLHAWGSHPNSSFSQTVIFKKRSLYPYPWQGLGWPLLSKQWRQSSSCCVGESIQNSEFQMERNWGWLRDTHQHQPLASFTQLWASQITARLAAQSGILLLCHRMCLPYSLHWSGSSLSICAKF